MDVKKRISELREEIRYHDRKYYVENNPVISDYEYDQLMEELKKLESSILNMLRLIRQPRGSAVSLLKDSALLNTKFQCLVLITHTHPRSYWILIKG